MEAPENTTKKQAIEKQIRDENFSQGFEAAARFQAMKMGARWIDTYPQVHRFNNQ